MHTFKGRRLQLACLLDLAALLPALANGAEDVTKTGSALHRLPIVTQDPLTTSSDHNILKELNVRVVHDPEAWSLVEQSTLVFAVSFPYLSVEPPLFYGQTGLPDDGRNTLRWFIQDLTFGTPPSSLKSLSPALAPTMIITNVVSGPPYYPSWRQLVSPTLRPRVAALREYRDFVHDHYEDHAFLRSAERNLDDAFIETEMYFKNQKNNRKPMKTT
ncbi:MAG: hypothetical protein Q9162_005013 [Coniocarpon cinnabarinum]